MGIMVKGLTGCGLHGYNGKGSNCMGIMVKGLHGHNRFLSFLTRIQYCFYILNKAFLFLFQVSLLYILLFLHIIIEQ